MDSPDSYSYDEIGSERLEIATTNKTKVKISRFFGANANGTKLPILWPRASSSNFQRPTRPSIYFNLQYLGSFSLFEAMQNDIQVKAI